MWNPTPFATRLWVGVGMGGILVGLLAIEVFELSAPVFRLEANPDHPTFSIRNLSAYVTMHNLHWRCDVEAVGTPTHVSISEPSATIEVAPRSSVNVPCITMMVRSDYPVTAQITVQFETLGFTRTAGSRPVRWREGEAAN